MDYKANDLVIFRVYSDLRDEGRDKKERRASNKERREIVLDDVDAINLRRVVSRRGNRFPSSGYDDIYQFENFSVQVIEGNRNKPYSPENPYAVISFASLTGAVDSFRKIRAPESFVKELEKLIKPWIN